MRAPLWLRNKSHSHESGGGNVNIYTRSPSRAAIGPGKADEEDAAHAGL